MAQPNDESAQSADETPEIVVEPDEIVVEEAATSEAPVATATLTDEKAESPLAGERVIYVPSAEPPKARSNRVVGALLALLGTIVFALAYAGVGAAFIQLTGSTFGFGDLITDAIFWVPVLFFTVGFVLVVVLINRGPWWVHVAGSLLVALITYFGSIGMLLLVTGIAGTSAGFVATALSPYVLAATIVAREVSIWVGLLIARRGVRLTARNRADREAFESEQAGKSDGAAAA
jgi:hypothetical protein